MPTRLPTHEVDEIPESSFVAQYKENLPPPDRTTTSLASWRETTSGQAAAAAALARGRERGRGRGRGRGAPYWFWSQGEQTDPEEYQNVEVNNTQGAPDENSDEN